MEKIIDKNLITFVGAMMKHPKFKGDVVDVIIETKDEKVITFLKQLIKEAE